MRPVVLPPRGVIPLDSEPGAFGRRDFTRKQHSPPCAFTLNSGANNNFSLKIFKPDKSWALISHDKEPRNWNEADLPFFYDIDAFRNLLRLAFKWLTLYLTQIQSKFKHLCSFHDWQVAMRWLLFRASYCTSGTVQNVVEAWRRANWRLGIPRSIALCFYRMHRNSNFIFLLLSFKQN